MQLQHGLAIAGHGCADMGIGLRLYLRACQDILRLRDQVLHACRQDDQVFCAISRGLGIDLGAQIGNLAAALPPSCAARRLGFER